MSSASEARRWVFVLVGGEVEMVLVEVSMVWRGEEGDGEEEMRMEAGESIERGGSNKYKYCDGTSRAIKCLCCQRSESPPYRR
jgi:hypothetical protein